jgi:AbrB family looped-hinge helix DNA binding protein
MKYGYILQNMKVGERGQVTIPKDIREKFGIRPNAEVEFKVVNGSIVLRKAAASRNGAAVAKIPLQSSATPPSISSWTIFVAVN